MIRIILLQFTGPSAINLKIARRLARKISVAQHIGYCVLIDGEDVEMSEEFLQVLVSVACADKTKFCGLPILQQQMVVSLLKGDTV
jgi:hypothetical protein